MLSIRAVGQDQDGDGPVAPPDVGDEAGGGVGLVQGLVLLVQAAEGLAFPVDDNGAQVLAGVDHIVRVAIGRAEQDRTAVFGRQVLDDGAQPVALVGLLLDLI